MVAVIVCLTHEEPRLVPQAGVIQNLYVERLQFLDDAGKVDLAELDALQQDLGDALLVQPSSRFVREALPVHPAVVNDGDPLPAEALGQESARDLALAVVAAAHAKHRRESLLGELRVRGERRDHQDAGAGIGLRGRKCRMRAMVTNDEGHLGSDSSTRSPSTPPRALRSATALSAPKWLLAPAQAIGPVNGEARPIRTSARAGPPRAAIKTTKNNRARTMTGPPK
jgi:hypothetical protein